MTVLHISLPDDLRAFLEAQAAEEGHESMNEYVKTLFEEARKRKAMRDLVAKLDEALAGGPAKPMTRADWDAIEREASEGLRGESIRP